MNLFGKKKEQPRQAADNASIILKLRSTVEMLDKREVHLQKKVQMQVSEAKQKMASKDKRGALYCMKRKKMYEGEIEKIIGARMTLEQQMLALESQATTMETVKAMQQGARALKVGHAGMDADSVEEVMADIAEEMAQADEISKVIAAPADDVFDDDELLNELNELEELELESQLLEAPAIPTETREAAPVLPELPAVPTAPISAVSVTGETDDEDLKALRELEASMAV
jgi:charged multivesicular body protein 4